MASWPDVEVAVVRKRFSKSPIEAGTAEGVDLLGLEWAVDVPADSS
jgi:hypothetical protein